LNLDRLAFRWRSNIPFGWIMIWPTIVQGSIASQKARNRIFLHLRKSRNEKFDRLQ
jgi:hypothetical protein